MIIFTTVQELSSSLFLAHDTHAGGRTAAEIVNWLKKRTGPPAQELTTVEGARAFTKKDDVVVVGFFKDRESDGANAFISAADTQDSVTFGITSVKEVADALDAKFDSIILFKQVGVCGCVGVEVWDVLCVCREGGCLFWVRGCQCLGV